jgi:hypothetical protein
MCVVCVLCFIVVLLPPGENPFAVKNRYLLLAKYNYNNRDKEDEMDRACSTNGEKMNAYRILVGKARIYRYEHLDLRGRIILK